MAGTSDVEPLRARLRQALLTAMTERDLVAVRALRSALGAIDNAEAVVPTAAPPTSTGAVIAGAVTGFGATEAARLHLSEHQIERIVMAEVADRRSAAADYERAGQVDRAARLVAEADVLAAHLATT